MQQHHTFIRDEVLPSYFANRLQDRMAPLSNLRLRRFNATTIEIPAGANDDAVVVNIGGGRWRMVEATVQRAMAGGAAAGAYDIFVTAKDNDIRAVPEAYSDFTDYTFALAIVAAGATPAIVAGAVEIYRKVGSLTWDGAAIVPGSVVQTIGSAVNAASAPDDFTVGGNLSVAGTIAIGADVSLYRRAADTLHTDDTFESTQDVIAQQGATRQTRMGGVSAGSALSGIAFGLAGDTLLFRNGAGELRTGGLMRVDTDLLARNGGLTSQVLVGSIAGAGGIALGVSGDTNLYRAAAGVLKSDGSLRTGGDQAAQYGLAAQVQMGARGPAGVAGVSFGSVDDANLYRVAAGVVKTDGILRSGSDQTAQHTTAAQVQMGARGPAGVAGLSFGSADDANLYRLAAGVLKTDGAVRSSGDQTAQHPTAAQVQMGARGPAAQAGISFGSTDDVSFYRDSGLALRTPNRLLVDGSLWASQGSTKQVMIGDVLANGFAGVAFGPGTDAALYRSATGVLATDGQLTAGGDIVSRPGSGTTEARLTTVAGGALTFGGDTTLKRGAAGDVRSVGQLSAGSAVVAAVGAAAQTQMTGAGPTGQAGVAFGSANDTNLYRLAAGTLQADGNVNVAGTLSANRAVGVLAANSVVVGWTGTALGPALSFGTALDTNLYRAAAGVVKTDGAFASSGSMVSALPAAPVDGQECHYVADATNGIVWHLKYRAADPSAYKWQFIGGSDAYSLVDTSESTSAVAFGDLTTPGPSYTVPLAGDYTVEWGAISVAAAAGGDRYMGVRVGATDPTVFTHNALGWGGAGAATGAIPGSRSDKVAAVASGTVLKAVYRAGSGVSSSFQQRWLTLRPKRVG